jgi:hypothetical protein
VISVWSFLYLLLLPCFLSIITFVAQYFIASYLSERVLLKITDAGFCKGDRQMDRGLEGKDDIRYFCVSYIKSPKKSINWITSKPAETTDV